MRYFITAAIGNLWESKVTSVFTAVTLSVALGFLGTYLAVFINMKAALGGLSERFPLSVYLEDGISSTQQGAVEKRLKGDPSVSGFDYTSKEKALAQFKGSTEDGGALVASLGKNPLPASLDVRLKADAKAEAVSKLVGDLKVMPGVDEVQYLKDEAGRLRSMLGSLRLAGMALGFGVLLGVVFISYSTLRLAVLRHGDEIDVLKLMGATRLFIMGPFLLEGILQGMAAAGLSLGVLYAILRAVSGTQPVMLIAPGGLAFLPAWASAGMLLAGGLLGLMGSLFAFGRTLRM